jgi:aminopeptidase-like protein
VLKRPGVESAITDFSPYGYDERQYCSPGIDLSVGLLSRTPHGQFAEYHTSADNLDFVDPASLADSLTECLGILEVLEGEATYINQNPKCEPQLGKRGLYDSIGGHRGKREMEIALLWVLNLSDGDHSLLDIAERSSMAFSVIRAAADRLVSHGLIKDTSSLRPSMRESPNSRAL